MTTVMATEPVLTARGLMQGFGERSVLDGADLELRHGEVLAVVGVSGSGKSTLLYALAGLRQPDGGTVAWNGHAKTYGTSASRTSPSPAARHAASSFSSPRSSTT